MHVCSEINSNFNRSAVTGNYDTNKTDNTINTQRAFMCAYSNIMDHEKVTWMRSLQYKNDLAVPTNAL